MFPPIRYTVKKFVQVLTQWFARHVPVRGRHRLADLVGRYTMEPVVRRNIHGLVVELDRDVQYHRMIMFDLYEENVLNYLRRRLRPGMVVFDPGCNIGYFAAQLMGLVQPGGPVWSFEPSPICQERIGRNNPIGAIPGWRLFPMALTSHSGRMTFYDTPRVITRGYAVLEDANTPKDRIPVEVEVTSLDDFCATHGIGHIDFLKLDIEDSELPALKGASRMLAQGAIDTILVETTTHPDRADLNRSIRTLLRVAGFTPFEVRRNGTLVPVRPEELPPGKEDLIWERKR